MEELRWTAKAVSVQSLACVRMPHPTVVGAMERTRARFMVATGDGVRREQAVAALETSWRPIVIAGEWIERILHIHRSCRNVLSLCAPHIGLQQGVMAPGWHAWERHHDAAADRASTALQRLHSAWSRGLAAMDALSMIEESPAWGDAARDLLRLATQELDMALDALRLMQHALIVEFAAARRLLLVISVRHPTHSTESLC